MSPETQSTSEHIGKYRIHPVANMFPLLTGEEFENFKRSIVDRGQLEPIIVQGDLLLDGRNRLRACIDCKLAVKVREFEETDADAIASYILTQNIHRRHLTREQQILIVADAKKWMIAERNRRRKIQASKEGGRGNRKTLLPNGSKVSEAVPKSRQRNARSTIGQVAALAESSHRQAAQALRILDKGTPDLVEKVKKGEITFRQAEKQLPQPMAPRTTRSSTPAVPLLPTSLLSHQSETVFLEQVAIRLKEAKSAVEISNAEATRVIDNLLRDVELRLIRSSSRSNKPDKDPSSRERPHPPKSDGHPGRAGIT